MLLAGGNVPITPTEIPTLIPTMEVIEIPAPISTPVAVGVPWWVLLLSIIVVIAMSVYAIKKVFPKS